jgi:uncharacterized protein YjbJ (UPF0337 family)
MDKDRVKGAAHEAKGAIKEAAGKVTGDKKTQAEGMAEKGGGQGREHCGPGEGCREKVGSRGRVPHRRPCPTGVSARPRRHRLTRRGP